MILVDYIGHMVSTESEEELHEFASEKMGMKRTGYQEKGYVGFWHPHYDLLGQTLLWQAIGLGAEQVPIQDLIKRAWWRQKLLKEANDGT